MEEVVTTIAHNACFSRKLLVGEQVEVRQQEKGLRGSWHPATVVKLKPCRRVVEYDELLTSDGLNKLRECIPVAREAEEVRVSGRQTYSLPGTTSCGFIRPRPPPCFELLCSRSWTKGLLVDVFYEDAWWEGILLEDVVSLEEVAKVRVFFPDEGDTLQASVKNIRLSQGWNAVTGQWTCRGYWMLPNLDGVGSFSLVMETWRRKMRTGKVDPLKRESVISFAVSSSALSTDCLKKMNGEQKEQKEAKDYSSTYKVQKPGKMDDCSGIGIPCKDLFPELCRTFTNGLGQKDSCHKAQEAPEQNDSLQIKIGGKKHFVVSNQGKCQPLPGEQGISSPSELLASLTRHGKSVSECTGNVGKQSLKNKLQNNKQLGKVPQLKLKKINPRKVAEKDDKNVMRVDETIAGFDICRENSVDRNACARYSTQTGLYNTGGNITSTCGREPLSGKSIHDAMESFSGMDRVRVARYLVKMKLQHAGWRTEYRQKPGRSKEAVYISPDGCHRCWSLTSACRAWRKDQNISINDWKVDSKSMGLLKIYDIRERWMSSKESNRGRKTKMLSGWNGKCRGPSNMGHITNREIEDMMTAIVSSGKKYAMASVLSTELSKPINNELMVAKRQELMHSSTKMIPCRIPNDIPVEDFPDESPKKVAGGPTNVMNYATLKHKIKCSVIMEDERGFKNSTALVNGGGPKCKRCLPSSNEVSTLFTKKTGKKKVIVQDSLPFNEPKYKKSKTVSKRAQSKRAQLLKSKGSHSHGGSHMQVLLPIPGKGRDPSLNHVGFGGVHLKRRTVLSWLIDMGLLTEDERVCYLRRKDGRIMKEGQVTREGVLCKCCRTVFTLSKFESHSGSKCHHPCANIFLNDGRSLSRCQMQAWALQNRSKHGHTVRNEEDYIGGSDDTCGICGDGGELILCDRCPSTFHADCLGLKVIPEGDWFCPSCRCAACGSNLFDCFGGTLYQKSSVLCDQCEREYHVECLKAKGTSKLGCHPEKNRFCGRSCEKIFLGLRGRVGAVNLLGGGFSWTLLRCVEQDPEISMEVVAEHNSKLSVALGVMQECFVPMIDPCTKTDIISQVLYNQRSKLNRLNYHGFYTMLLERGDELISVATIRVHGSEVAEMPLIGTRFQYRRQGMCRSLMGALEEMLKNLGVTRLILPAVPELLETWISSFNFQHISPSERLELIGLNLLSFPGTIILQKFLAPQQCQLIKVVPMEGRLNEHVNHFKAVSFVNGSSKPEEPRPSLEAMDIKAGEVDVVEGAVSAALNKKMDSLEECPSQQVHEVNFSKGKPSEASQQNVVLLQGSPEPPAEQEFSWSSALGRNKMKDENKFRSLFERSTAPRVELRRLDDDCYDSKVVLTMTRSKRLVKSYRWIADALKELRKDGKSSKRIISVEESGSRASVATEVKNTTCNLLDMQCASFTEDVGSKSCAVLGLQTADCAVLKSQPSSIMYDDNDELRTSTSAVGERMALSGNSLIEEAGLSNVLEDHETIGNVYLRSRKRMPKQSLLLEDNRLTRKLKKFSVLRPNCVDKSTFPNSDACQCAQNAINLNHSDSPQIMYLNSQRESAQRLTDCGKIIRIKQGSQCRGGFIGDTLVESNTIGNGNIIKAVEVVWNDAICYSRCRKRYQR